MLETPRGPCNDHARSWDTQGIRTRAFTSFVHWVNEALRARTLRVRPYVSGDPGED